ncbi:MAG: PQQ-dependent sugar dehydrogenase [Gammaproteobacteria bacterium]
MRLRTRVLAALGGLLAAPALMAAPDLSHLQLPPGFDIAVYAEGVENARQLALAPDGVLYVGSREAGKVYAVVDGDGDHRAEQVHVLARGLSMPSGVAFRDGSLYVAAVNRILRFDDIAARLSRPGRPVVVTDTLPAETHHGWKFIAFGPDGRLYVPVGAPCNVCAPPAPFASILSMRADGSDVVTVARGVRNSVGFDWQPASGALWFSDNGRDWLGDEVPPGEINRVSEPGEHFGFPFIHGGDIRDPEFGDGHAPADYTPPVLRLEAHAAPLGIEFYRGTAFPPEYAGALFVAEHGSWNRRRKVGYRVMVARFAADGSVASYTPFITGWLRGQAYLGRPADVATMADGTLLIADDHAGVIYRVTYAGGAP